MNVWVDVDNPPQARYLLPLARRFADGGDDVFVTARDYGDTFAILESEGVDFEPVGSSFGKGLHRKLGGLLGRARALRRVARRRKAPFDLVLTGSRAAAVAARTLGIPSFAVIDYEYVDLSVFRLSGTTVLHPDVIDRALLRQRGIPAARLVAFEGLKEDLSFAGVDVDAVEPHDFGTTNGMPRILFRPPAEDSHYFRHESRDLALALLRYLAGQAVQVVFSPRVERQVRDLHGAGAWAREPIVLDRPIGTVPLLKGVDAVVSAGGTMLREAAYLGIPAYSIFRSRTGSVDEYLASLGRLAIVASPADFSRIRLVRRDRLNPLRASAGTVESLQRKIVERVQGGGSTGGSQNGDGPRA